MSRVDSFIQQVRLLQRSEWEHSVLGDTRKRTRDDNLREMFVLSEKLAKQEEKNEKGESEKGWQNRGHVIYETPSSPNGLIQALRSC